MDQKKYNGPLQQQFYELLLCLHQLGRDNPQLLIHLTEIVEPHLSNEKRVPILGNMFQDLPAYILQQTAEQLKRTALDSPSEMQTFRLLLSFRELQQLLQQMSFLQLLHLSNNIIPPGPANLQLEFLQKAQQIFQSWSQQTLQSHHQVLADTPLHMERQQLIQLEPSIPWELLHFLIELLKLPPDELFSLQEWISKLPSKHLEIILQIIQIEPALILETKKRMDAVPFSQINMRNSLSKDESSDGMNIEFSSQNGMMPQAYGTQPDQFNTMKTISPLAYSIDMTYQLRIARQPPARTVYQRILKPFPAVMLSGGNFDASSMNNLFVEAALLRTDSDVEIPTILEGNKIVRISNGAFATFKKLKILATSQQQGTLFRLRFTLKKIRRKRI